MNRPLKTRSKRSAVSVQVPTTPAAAPDAPDAGAIARLEQERDALRAELEAAHVRIAALERQRADALNRVEWVLDSLHTLSAGG